MEKQKAKAPPVKVLAFRADANMAKAVEELAKSRGLSTSDFMRAVMGKVLEPAKDRAEESGAVIKSLSPSSQKKVARVSAIQKILIGLRAEQAKAGALDDVFQDGDGEVVAGKIKALEVELAGLKKEVRKELAGLSKKSGGRVGLGVYRAEAEAEAEAAAEEGSKGELPCPGCGALVVFKKGKDGGLLCPVCGAGVVVEEAEGEEAEGEEAEGEEAEGEEAEGEEAEGEEAEGEEAEEGPAEIKAARFLEITGLINSLKAGREKQSYFDYYLGDGPNVEALLVQGLERELGGDLLDDELFGKLRDAAARAVAIRKKIVELKASGAAGSGALVEELETDLNELRAGLPAEIKKKAPAKKSGLFGGGSVFD